MQPLLLAALLALEPGTALPLRKSDRLQHVRGTDTQPNEFASLLSEVESASLPRARLNSKLSASSQLVEAVDIDELNKKVTPIIEEPVATTKPTDRFPMVASPFVSSPRFAQSSPAHVPPLASSASSPSAQSSSNPDPTASLSSPSSSSRSSSELQADQGPQLPLPVSAPHDLGSSSSALEQKTTASQTAQDQSGFLPHPMLHPMAHPMAAMAHPMVIFFQFFFLTSTSC